MGNHKRFFIGSEQINGSNAVLNGNTARQITKVLRLKEGDEICLLDGCGTEHCARIVNLSKDEVALSILTSSSCPNEPQFQLTLAVCLPKADKLETIIQKGTELGVSDFVLAYSERTVARPDDSKVGNKLARWKKIAAEATEQSGRGKVPELHGIIPYSTLLKTVRDYDLSLLAWEEEDTLSIKDALRASCCVKSALLIIGPEGGLTEKEAADAKAAGAKCVSLGKRVLRVETAAIAAAGVIMYELEGEL